MTADRGDDVGGVLAQAVRDWDIAVSHEWLAVTAALCTEPQNLAAVETRWDLLARREELQVEAAHIALLEGDTGTAALSAGFRELGAAAPENWTRHLMEVTW